MSVATRREKILQDYNLFCLLPDDSEYSAISKIEKAAEGFVISIPEYSNHQKAAAKIVVKALGYTVDEILYAYATTHPLLFRTINANVEHYENWSYEHSLSAEKLAELWISVPAVIESRQAVESDTGGSTDARRLFYSSSRLSEMIANEAKKLGA